MLVHIRKTLRLLAASLSKYVYINFCCCQAVIIVHEIGAKLIIIKLGTKRYIPKLATFMKKKDIYSLLWSISKQLSSCLSKTLPHPTPVLNGHNQAGWNTKQKLNENGHPFYIVFEVLKVT